MRVKVREYVYYPRKKTQESGSDRSNDNQKGGKVSDSNTSAQSSQSQPLAVPQPSAQSSLLTSNKYDALSNVDDAGKPL